MFGPTANTVCSGIGNRANRLDALSLSCGRNAFLNTTCRLCGVAKRRSCLGSTHGTTGFTVDGDDVVSAKGGLLHSRNSKSKNLFGNVFVHCCIRLVVRPGLSPVCGGGFVAFFGGGTRVL